MQTKIMSGYIVNHFNGTVENIVAETMEQALENMSVTEETSPVTSAVRKQTGLRTIIDDLPSEVTLAVSLADGLSDSGCIATPSTATVHSGDVIKLQAVPARTYEFTSWVYGGKVLSTDMEFTYTVPELGDGVTAMEITANFRLSSVSWTTAVSPNEASTAGCIAFPTSGTTPANGNQQFIEVPVDGYTFDHWERNGVSLGTNQILEDTVAPLAQTEESAVYTAVFTANA
jgi:hypothetical protein